MGLSVQSGSVQTLSFASVSQFSSTYAKKLETLSFLKMEMLQYLVERSVQTFPLLILEVVLNFDWSRAVRDALGKAATFSRTGSNFEKEDI